MSESYDQTLHYITNFAVDIFKMIESKDFIPPENATQSFIEHILCSMPEELNEDFKGKLLNLLVTYRGKVVDTRRVKPEFHPEIACREMWRVLLGKSILIDSLCGVISIKDILMKPDISHIRRNNKIPTTSQRKKLENAVKDTTTIRKLLECIPGCSTARAESILAACNPLTVSESFEVKCNNRRIPKKIIPRFLTTIQYLK